MVRISSKSNSHRDALLEEESVKGCVHYIFAGLFCMSKREHLQNKEKCFLFHFDESSSRSWDNQILIF